MVVWLRKKTMKKMLYLFFSLLFVLSGCSQNEEKYINSGNAKTDLKDYNGAITDFTKVIESDPKFVEAYFNRGIAKILLGQKHSGCLDLSKAGDLGLVAADEAIKKYCK